VGSSEAGFTYVEPLTASGFISRLLDSELELISDKLSVSRRNFVSGNMKITMMMLTAWAIVQTQKNHLPVRTSQLTLPKGSLR
jgi:hypothetical protein